MSLGEVHTAVVGGMISKIEALNEAARLAAESKVLPLSLARPKKETIPNLGSRSLFSSHLTSFFLRRFGKFTELRQVSGIIRNCSKIL